MEQQIKQDTAKAGPRPKLSQAPGAGPFGDEAPVEFIPQKATFAGNAALTLKILCAAGLIVSLLWLLD